LLLLLLIKLCCIRREIENVPGGRTPAILCVIYGLSSAAYRREDGVFVVQITVLGGVEKRIVHAFL